MQVKIYGSGRTQKEMAAHSSTFLPVNPMDRGVGETTSMVLQGVRTRLSD